jgi:DNA polymerase-3 subunit beta
LKLTTKREDLVAKLSVVSRAVSTRAATQALSGILLSADGDGVTLRATDLELGLKTKLEATVDGEGTILLPGRLLAEVSRSLGDATVEIELRESERDVEIRSGGSSFHLRTLPSEDFPSFPEEEGDPLSIPAAALAATVELVARAASRDDMRPVLTGVLVNASGTEMTMVATDSYRLAVKRTELEAPIGGELEANIPAKALRELGRIVAADSVDSVSVALQRNQAIFKAGEIVLNTRLIEGQFPNFRQLLPESYEHDVRLPRPELLDAAQRAAAAQLLGGGADDRRLDPRRRRRGRDDAGSLRGRAAGDRLQPRVPARGDRKRRGRRGDAAPDLAAASGPAAAGRQRRLSLSGDADPPQRVSRRCWSRPSKRGRCGA